MEDLSDLGEEGIIRLFDSGQFSAPVVQGIGDDCAVIGTFNGKLLLWTMDLLVEQVHFNRNLGTPQQLGAKSLAVNLSDIAAMGGEPIAALLGLSLPAGLEKSWLTQFRNGLQEVANEYHCQIVGGDTCGSAEKVTVSVTLLGQVAEDEILLRRGASDGDDIWISGIPGLSALGLEILQGHGFGDDSLRSAAVERHLSPVPMVALARDLASSRLATSCIDTSDGIAIDLDRICRANDIGAIIDEKAIPLPHTSLMKDSRWMELALHGGEDYLLLFTATNSASGKLAQCDQLYKIGMVTNNHQGVRIKRHNGSLEPLPPTGFSHF